MQERIHLAISEDKLAQLMRNGSLCAADFSCLDAHSKRTVWKLCLSCCQNEVRCTQCTQLNWQQISIITNADK
ncbi:hypothetical protein L9G16_12345 [Shewanella sp. A25]|nr:hypothetical protein [Shewanella shenzhenensis]